MNFSSDTIDRFPNYRIKGGTPTFLNTLAEQVTYPRSGRNRGIMGASLVYITLNPVGHMREVQIATSLDKDFDREI